MDFSGIFFSREVGARHSDDGHFITIFFIGKCGWFQTSVTFDGVADGNWIIQHVKKTRKFTKLGVLERGCCVDCKADNEGPVVINEFYEAFQKQHGSSKVDISSGDGIQKCSSGEIKNEKTAIYFGSMEEDSE